MCINYNWWSFDSCRLHLSLGVEKKERKLHGVVRLNGPEGGEGPTLKMNSFFWTFCKQILVLPVFSNSVASASLFYPKKPGALGMTLTSLFCTPIGRQPQIPLMLHFDFYHIVSSGSYHLLLGLLYPLIWFTCWYLYSQCSWRDTIKRNIISFSLHSVTNFLLPME